MATVVIISLPFRFSGIRIRLRLVIKYLFEKSRNYSGDRCCYCCFSLCSLSFCTPGDDIPLGDSGQFTATIELEAGAFFERTNKVAQQFESILLEQPEVEKVSSNVGFEITRNSTYFSRYSMGSVNTASSVVTLKYLNDCDKPNGMTSQRDIWQIMDGVEDKARRTISGLRRIAIKEMGVDVMATSAAPIQIAVYGEDLDILYLSQNIN